MLPQRNNSLSFLALAIVSASFGVFITLDHIGLRILGSILTLVAIFGIAGRLFSSDK